jgi:hypothetical protein
MLILNTLWTEVVNVFNQKDTIIRSVMWPLWFSPRFLHAEATRTGRTSG